MTFILSLGSSGERHADHTAKQNTFGAILFFSYIIFALLITGLISTDVWLLYLRSIYKSSPIEASKDPQRSLPKRTLYTLIALTILSFSILSYHMLSFLVQSYTTWSDNNNVPMPTNVLDLSRLAEDVHIWRWATHSTLFQDFAHDLCHESSHFWWTKLALSYSLSWNVVMIVQGL